MSEIAKIIQQNLSKSERNLLTQRRLIPVDQTIEEDILIISGELGIETTPYSISDLSQVLNETHLFNEGKENHTHLLREMVKLITMVNSDEIKEEILETISRCEEGIIELVDFYRGINNYLKMLLLEHEMMFPSHFLNDEIENSSYYNLLQPIYNVGDKFIPYFYLTELGKFIFMYLSNIKVSLNPIKSYCEELLDIREDNNIFTSLDRTTIEVTKKLLTVWDDGSEEYSNKVADFVELIADFLNAKIWILMTALTSLGEEIAELSMERIINDEIFKDFSLEYFTSPFFILYTKYFRSHNKLSWSEYDPNSSKSKGLIIYLTEIIFSFLDEGVEIDLSMLEGMFEVLRMPSMDWRGIRFDILQNFLFLPVNVDSWVKEQIVSIFNLQVDRIQHIGEDKFKKFIAEGKVDAENFSEFKFSELLFKVMQDIEF